MAANYFDVLGVKPLYGRFFRPEEEATRRSIPYVIISYSFWNTHFAGDPAVVGKPLELVRHQVIVIGVAPKGFVGAMPGLRQDMWVTLGTCPRRLGESPLASRANASLNCA